jgi:hypothetical protein
MVMSRVQPEKQNYSINVGKKSFENRYLGTTLTNKYSFINNLSSD